MPDRKRAPRRRRRLLFRACIILLALAALAISILTQPQSTTPTPAEHAELLRLFGGNATPGDPRYQGHVLRSFYLPMRDGIKIAVDLYLPKDLQEGETIPAILMPTRYWRRWEFQWPVSMLVNTSFHRAMFVDYGYAVVSIDARGTGASFGSQPFPWSPQEIEDYLEIVDWTIQQPWSNGRAGAWGISYGGACAEHMAAIGHPALKAAIAQYTLFDVFPDIAYPGGVFNSGFVGRWGAFNEALDNGTLPDFMPWAFRTLLRGPGPVDGSQGRQKLALAIKDHAENTDIYLAAASVAARDQTAVTVQGVAVGMDDFSPHTAWKRAPRAPRPALYSWGGWFDGAYGLSLLRRYAEVGRVEHRAVLGPWNHAATHDVDPFSPPDKDVVPNERVQLLEQIRYFDYYLKDIGHKPETGLLYSRLGETAFRHATQWPSSSPAIHTMQLHGNGTLTSDGARNATDEPMRRLLAGDAPTGLLNRWKTQLGRGDVVYPDMGQKAPLQQDNTARLSWVSAPLDEGMVLEGLPQVQVVVSLDSSTAQLSPNATDMTLFAYLEAITPAQTAGSRSIHILSEGMLRGIHRATSSGEPASAQGGFWGNAASSAPIHPLTDASIQPITPGAPTLMTLQLQPTAVQLEPGWQLRLTLTRCDAGQFTCLPYDSSPAFVVHPGGTLSLPVVRE